MEKEQFSVQEVAEKLSLSKKTIERYISDGKITPIFYGKKKFIKKEELERFQKENEQSGKQEQPKQLKTESVDKKQELFKKIWNLANKLRGQIDGWDFKQYILGILFYRYISEDFEKYINSGETDPSFPGYASLNDADVEDEVRALTEEKGFFIYPSQLFCNVYKDAANNENINITLDNIFKAIEKSAVGYESEDSIKGLFDDIDLNSKKLGDTFTEKHKKILQLLDVINSIEFVDEYGDIQNDLFGDAYEYLMGMYASEAGKSGGEYFTPQEVSEILAGIVCNDKEKLGNAYDPTCGSGSLLLKISKRLGVENVAGFYGQELNRTTYNLCRINMHLHGVNYSKFDIKCADTLVNPQHLDKAGKFEAIVANPPYSLKAVDNGDRIYDLDVNDDRFAPAGVVAPDKALDLAFVMHILHHLSEDGTAAIVLPLGAFHRSNANEDAIRKYLVSSNYVDAVITLPEDIFFGTGIQTGILVLKKNKKDDKILFVDGSKEYERITISSGRRVTKNILRQNHINAIIKYYADRTEVAERAVLKTNDEVKEAGYNICSNNYIKTEKELTSDDFINTIIDYYQYQINANRYTIKDSINKVEEDTDE